MEVKILAFGKIADVTGQKEWKWQDIADTTALRKKLEQEFPALQTMKYQLAVNKKLANAEVGLENDAEVALLPPYSGG
ncbi:MoaD/ThiS family protein [Nafulsella turpanensis]|uniref:MoaD/ThiS family protein n=1 Tax=Nafulsella turpanensis TaxID=1265690 RepID=UPI00034C64A1|nr:MoaD/ThiS family protein [Nafulsella turpanensis]